MIRSGSPAPRAGFPPATRGASRCTRRASSARPPGGAGSRGCCGGSGRPSPPARPAGGRTALACHLATGLHGGDRSDSECLARLAKVAARALGVATRADLVDDHRLRSFASGPAGHADLVDAAAEAAGLVPVLIDGGERLPVPAWADPGALPAAGPGLRGRHRVTLLSPFDSLVWDRRRTRRMFGFEHSLVAYLPREKRVHGYYAMSLLAGGCLAGRADPVRRGQTLAARQVSLAGPAAARPMATARPEAAEWASCSAVTVDRVSPPQLSSVLKAALADAGC